jgi:proteic killer suppression protein
VDIESIRHKALRSFVATGKAKALVEPERIRRMIAYMLAIADVEELKVPPNFGAHELTGDRAGTWSLFVTRNWRMTFRIEEGSSIVDLDLEDYH